MSGRTPGRIYSLALIAALVGCHSKSKLDDVGKGAPAGVAASSTGSNADADAPKRAPVTPASLQPIIHELGRDDELPTSIVVELAQPVVDKDGIGNVSAESVVKITPEAAGRLTFSNTSELTFTPLRPFAFDTSYTIELARIETRDGVVTPPKGETWSYTFKTPKFKLLEFAPTDINVAIHAVTAEVLFSGPILPNLARAALAFSVGGKPAANIDVLPSERNDVFTVQIRDPKIEMGGKLGVSLKAGLASALGPIAPAAIASFVINTENVVTIKTAVAVDGANGYYLEVVCNDAAAPAGHRYSYFGGSYSDLSERCQLDDEAISRIHFKPAVK